MNLYYSTVVNGQKPGKHVKREKVTQFVARFRETVSVQKVRNEFMPVVILVSILR